MRKTLILCCAVRMVGGISFANESLYQQIAELTDHIMYSSNNNQQVYQQLKEIFTKCSTSSPAEMKEICADILRDLNEIVFKDTYGEKEIQCFFPDTTPVEIIDLGKINHYEFLDIMSAEAYDKAKLEEIAGRSFYVGGGFESREQANQAALNDLQTQKQSYIIKIPAANIAFLMQSLKEPNILFDEGKIIIYTYEKAVPYEEKEFRERITIIKKYHIQEHTTFEEQIQKSMLYNADNDKKYKGGGHIEYGACLRHPEETLSSTYIMAKENEGDSDYFLSARFGGDNITNLVYKGKVKTKELGTRYIDKTYGDGIPYCMGSDVGELLRTEQEPEYYYNVYGRGGILDINYPDGTSSFERNMK